MNQYEAMFLFDPTFGSSLENCEAEIRRILGRAEAEIVFCKRWDERRLAYKIKGRKRGLYVLVYFKSHPSKITAMERDAQLSEHVLRLLVLRADETTPEMMEQATVARVEAAEAQHGEHGDRPHHRTPDFEEFGDGGRPRHRRSGRKPETAAAATDTKGPE